MKKLLKLREVMQATGYGKTSIYKKVKAGEFPAPVKLGEKSSAWLESEVSEWIDSKIAESREHKEAA